MAARFKRALVASDVVQIDPKITDDAARVLRPVGTTNKKRGDVAPVYVLRNSDDVRYAVWQVEEAIARLEGIPGVELPFELPAGRPVRRLLNTDLEYTPDFPKVSAHAVAEHCAQIRWFRDTGSAGSYEHWIAASGTVKHTIEGEALAHEWSAAAPGYDYDATQAKLDDVFKTGPALCSTFSNCNPTGCQGCRFAGKVKTPLQVGHFGEAPVETYAQPAEEPQLGADAEETPAVADAPIISVAGEAFLRMVDGTLEPIWKTKFVLDEVTCYEIDAANHCIKYTYLFEKKSKSGEDVEPSKIITIQVSPYLIYPLRVIDTEQHGMVMQLATKSAREKQFRYVDLPAALINEGNARFRQELGRYGIALLKTQGEPIMSLLAHAMQSCGRERDTARLVNKFGWQSDSDLRDEILRAGFAYGESIYYNANGTVEKAPANISPELQAQLTVGTVAGTFEAWKAAADCYNTPAWAALQSPIIFALAAPLIKHIDQLDGSLINYFSPESGVGKTTAIQVALAIYGNPSKMTLRGGGSSQAGITEFAAYTYMAGVGSMPLLLDEMGNTAAEKTSPIIHAAAAGQERIRGTQRGGITGGRKWNTPMFGTSNESLLEKLGETKGSAEAEHVRTFEIRVPKVLYKADVEARQTISKIFTNYGHVGLRWIPYVVGNIEQLMADVAEEERNMSVRWSMLNEERFHQKLLSAYFVAYRHAKQLGLISFDEETVTAFAHQVLVRARTARKANIKSPLQVLLDFIQQHAASALIMDRRPKRTSGYPSKYEVPQVLREPSATGFSMTLMQNNHKGGNNQREVFIAEPALRAYFRKQNMSWDALVDALASLCGRTVSELTDRHTPTPVKLRRLEMAPQTKFSTGAVRALYVNLSSKEFRTMTEVFGGDKLPKVVALFGALEVGGDAPPAEPEVAPLEDGDDVRESQQ